MMYTVTFVLVMNNDKYNALPDDLKKVVDENSGLTFSKFAADVQQSADGPSRVLAVENGNKIVTLDESQSQAWAEAALPVTDNWLAEMKERGLDGEAMIERAKELMTAQ